MPDIWMDEDTAVTVPVSRMPLVDKTDFVTLEDAIVYDTAGMALVWNFCTTLGAMTTTDFTPTTSGVHDWIEEGTNRGMYSVEIPLSGGTVNNDTSGFGWITGETDATLPFAGPIIGFRVAELNALLIDDAYSATRGLAGTALPAAAADAMGGLPISDAGGLDLDAKIGALTFTVANLLDTNMLAINGATAAALRLALSAGTIIPGNVQWSANAATLTTLECDTAEVIITAADHWNGRIIIFINGTLIGQATDISDSVKNGSFELLTFSAVTAAPADESDFIIL